MTRLRLLAICLALCAPSALAGRLEIPLRVPLEPLRQALAAQLAASKATPNVIYREGPCRYLNLDKPSLEAVYDGRLRLVETSSAALGVELFGACPNAASWKGSMEFTFVPQIDNAGRLRLRVVNLSSPMRTVARRSASSGSSPSATCIRAWSASATTSAPRAPRSRRSCAARRRRSTLPSSRRR